MQMSMKRSKSIDLTSGPILKTLAELALPIMASSFLGTAYNITDMGWIGTGRPSPNGRTGKHSPGLRQERL